MRDRPLLIVAARLRADVIDGFLDQLKNSNAALWSLSADKSAEEAVRETFFNLIWRFAPAGSTPIPPQPAPRAVLPPCESADAKTEPRAVCTCGQHAARPQKFAFAEQSFLAYPDPLMSRRASRPSSTFFLPHQTKPKELP
jgi:hypothetical protein